MSNNYKILIVEDEMIIAANISMIISNLGYEVTGIMPRGEDALKSIESTRPDLVLMDIALKGELDGLETAKIIHANYGIPLIFLTANSDDSTFSKAKEARPFAFISKPFKEKDLRRSIELVIEQTADELLDNFKIEDDNPTKAAYLLNDRIFIRYREKMLGIFMQDILFVQADRSYARLVTDDNEYLLSMPLGSFEEKLNSPEFIRIHRSYIINMTKIKSIGDNFSNVQIGTHTLPISKNVYDHLARKLKLI